MKLRLLLFAVFLILTIDSSAQFERKSVHASVTSSSYFKYGLMISYFPVKNLELGLGSSFNPLNPEYKTLGANFVIKSQRWAVNYRMNYYISNWIIKPKIVGSLAFGKNHMGYDDYYSLPSIYYSYNATLGIGLSARLNKKIRIEADIIYNKFAFKAAKGASPDIGEEKFPTRITLGATLSYQIYKIK